MTLLAIFLDGTTKIQLKGPFLNPGTLEPMPSGSMADLAQGINKSIRNSSGFDKLIVDTLGLTDSEAIELAGYMVSSKPVVFIR